MRKAKSRYAVAKSLGIHASSLYYKKKLPKKDGALRIRIEEALRYHPAYGHRRLAIHLRVNKKRVLRVMNLFHIRPFRRRGRKPRKTGVSPQRIYPNLLRNLVPMREGIIWAADFTYLPFKGKFVYLATVIDLFSREVVGWAVARNHTAAVLLQALFMGLSARSHPDIFHSDNGREYCSKVFTRALLDVGIKISRTTPASPWENGFQESFYSQFKIDLGDPERFTSLGELVYAIHRTIWEYNHTRIHLALKMPPKLFAEQRRKLV